RVALQSRDLPVVHVDNDTYLFMTIDHCKCSVTQTKGKRPQQRAGTPRCHTTSSWSRTPTSNGLWPGGSLRPASDLVLERALVQRLPRGGPFQVRSISSESP